MLYVKQFRFYPSNILFIFWLTNRQQLFAHCSSQPFLQSELMFWQISVYVLHNFWIFSLLPFLSLNDSRTTPPSLVGFTLQSCSFRSAWIITWWSSDFLFVDWLRVFGFTWIFELVWWPEHTEAYSAMKTRFGEMPRTLFISECMLSFLQLVHFHWSPATECKCVSSSSVMFAILYWYTFLQRPK